MLQDCPTVSKNKIQLTPGLPLKKTLEPTQLDHLDMMSLSLKRKRSVERKLTNLEKDFPNRYQLHKLD
jgi:hypothetical protein